MKYKLSWLIEEKVVFIKLDDELDADEFRQFMISLNQFVGDRAKVYVVLDVKTVTSRMHNVREISNVYSENRPTTTGFVILIGGTVITRFFVQMVISISRQEARFVKDLDEALVVLYRMDITLPPITVDMKTLS